MTECWICKRPLAPWFVIPSDDSWYSFNIAPHAASGGSMVGVHHKCRPQYLVAETPNGARTAPVDGNTDALREVIRESLEFHRDANAAFSAVINENGEKRDFIPAIRDLQRALWSALDGIEVVVRDDTPRDVEWKRTDDGGRMVRRKHR